MKFSPIGLIKILLSYAEARQLGRLRTREALEAHQQKRLRVFRDQVLRKSAFYAPLLDRRFDEWPVIDKAQWMAQFDSINTVGVALAEATAVAEKAEASRDFKPNVRDITVGLSTGTSGARGVFMASPAERQRWAGTMLAKLLDGMPRRRLRIALMLRANSGLYETLGAGPIQFRFFDMARSFPRAAAALAEFDPTILVAPPHVLSALAREREAGRLAIDPRRVISVAEVLDPLDRKRIEAAFAVRVEQIYQATEGFLGATCPHGLIHLNEEFLIVEREWVDAARTRFVPVITDLYRTSQPIVRYRLNDVLVPRREPCPCGRPTLALDRIEGREDDVLWLPAVHGAHPVPVFSDVISRVFVRSLPGLEDYSLEETGPGRWRAGVVPRPDREAAERLLAAIHAAVAALGAQAPQVVVGDAFQPNAAKLRRIRGMRSSCRR